MHHAAGGGGLSLQTADEVEDAAGLGAPVQDVAQLDEVGPAARPIEVGVDEGHRRMGQDEDEAVVVAVEVGHGDHPVDARPGVGDLVRGGPRFGGEGEGGGGEGDEPEGEEQGQKGEGIMEPALSAARHAVSFIALLPGGIKRLTGRRRRDYPGPASHIVRKDARR